jgi:hypothetical protein
MSTIDPSRGFPRAHPSPSSSGEPPSIPSLSVLLARIFWSVLGPVILFGLVCGLVAGGTG